MQTPSPLTHGSTFGPFSRYQLVRHESHRGPEFSAWMVQDAETSDPTFPDMPAVIRQATTIEEAIAGLEVEVDDELADAIEDDYDRQYGEGDFPQYDAAGDEIEGAL